MIEKVKKLFKLAESGNIHESQLAFEKAVELMKLHSIDKSQLKSVDEIANEFFDIPNGGRPWARSLTNNIVIAFNGKCVFMNRGRKKSAHIFAELKDIKTIFLMLEYAFETIDKFAVREHKKLGNVPRGYILSYMNSYRIGLMNEMNKTLTKIMSYNEQDIEEETEYGIILYDREKLVKDAYDKEYSNVPLAKSSVNFRNRTGFASGSTDGKSVTFNPQTGSGYRNKLIAC